MQAEHQDERHDPFSEDDENLFNDIAARGFDFRPGIR